MKNRYSLLILFLILQPITMTANDDPVKVDLDVSEVPHLAKWGKQAQDLMVRWHPRLRNMIPTKGKKPTQNIVLKIRKTEKGVGGTSGNTITLASHWIEKHPEDLGLVLHELVHVIQAYPSGDPWWVTEGIAYYLRWGIYEGKPLSWFPRPKENQGYKKGYRVTAGFFLWLETEIEPGIVKKLNTAMRMGVYEDKIFGKETGRSLDDLWTDYVKSDDQR